MICCYFYPMEHDVLILGGGAAGFFTAINLAQMRPDIHIIILERGKDCLGKVRVSGGGRCNVTHAEFLPRELTVHYPRGGRELLGPFHRFMTGDTMAWFEERGVPLKIEADGRVFPESDSSQTIIDCFLTEAKTHNVTIKTKEAVKSIYKNNGNWQVTTPNAMYIASRLVAATGSSPKIWKLLEGLGHKIIPAVPSLFTFNCKDNRISDLPGISVGAHLELIHKKTDAAIKNASGGRMDESGIVGPLLITHWGFSGPAVLKLSAIAARELHAIDYRFRLRVNWLMNTDFDEVVNVLKEFRQQHGKQAIIKHDPFNLPKRLWQNLVAPFALSEKQTWAEIAKQQILEMATVLTRCDFDINGKSTFKEEFVTAGGVDLKEVDFKTFQSRLYDKLYFAGEVLDIDAVTGGFNFQNAWTSGYIAATAIAESFE